jgi:outer membrane receptor protein involved in Fe transport
VQFAPNGYGRMMKNAGASVSKGFELTASAKPIRDLGLQVAYGLTDARFTRYVDSVRVNGTYQQVNYKGKKVAMVPQNTLSVGADYWIGLKSRCLDGVRLSAQYTGAGPIYFTEANDRKQDFYGLMDGQMAFNKHNRSLILWIRNGFNEVYNTFYFESMGKAFIQRGAPRQLGITLCSSF